MFCEYCGRPLKEGETCQCRKKITPPQGGAPGNIPGRQPGSAAGGQPGNAAGFQPGAVNYNTSKGGYNVGGYPVPPNMPGNNGRGGYSAGTSQPKKKDGSRAFAIAAYILAGAAFITFLLLRVVVGNFLANFLPAFFLTALSYIAYIIPGALGAIAIVMAGLSFMNKNIRVMSFIAAGVSVLATAIVIIAIFAFPFEDDLTRAMKDVEEWYKDVDPDDWNPEEWGSLYGDDAPDKDTREDTDKTETEAVSNDITDLKANYEAGLSSYAQVKRMLAEYEAEGLNDVSMDAANSLRQQVETDLGNAIAQLVGASEYIEAFRQIKEIEDALPEDAYAASLRSQYESGFSQYLDNRSQELAQNGQTDEALALLDEARPYISDTSVIDTLTANVQSAAQSSEYIIADSDSRYLTRSEVESLSLREINYAKNEIYARHGRRFKSNELQTWFDSKSWYNGTVDPANFNESVFNDYEIKNIKLLTDVEFSRAKNGYQLDAN